MRPRATIPWKRLGAELVVIIAGVLIALGVDSWAGRRHDRTLEKEYLRALSEDLRSDSATFARTFLPALAQKDSALRLIAPVVRGGPLEGDTLAFLRAVALGGRLGTSATIQLVRPTTMDELTATGRLSLIESARLRAALVDFYFMSGIQSRRLSARTAGYPLFVHRYFPAELREGRMTAAMKSFGLARAVRAFRSDAFESLMNQEMNFLFMAVPTMERSAAAVNALLRAVEAELDRLERN